MLDILFDQEYVLDAAIEEAAKDARAEGEAKGVLNSLRSLMENLKFTAEQAMAALNIPENERDKYMSLLGK